MFRQLRRLNALKSSKWTLQSRALGQAAGKKVDLQSNASKFLLNVPATQVTSLKNGVRVASEDGFGEMATVGVWIDAGSRYENAKNNGVAHFLEHMAFKGTQKRSQNDLQVEIENMGAHLNAYTSREQTVYFAQCFKKDIPKAVEILSDILQNATFDTHAIDREREVILREMQEVEKLEEEVVFDRLHETAFQDCSLGYTILGPKENIMSIGKQDLVDYVKQHYRGPRVVVAGAGAVDHASLTKLAEQHFGNLPSDPGFDTKSVPKANFIGSDLRIRNDPTGLAHMAIAFEGKPWASEHSVHVMLMQALIGTWDRRSGSGPNMGSYLCNRVAEEKLARSVMAFNTCYKDTGLFGIYSVADPTCVMDLLWYEMEALVNLSSTVTDEELDRAKAQLKAVMMSQLDGSSQICEDIGRQILTYGRRLTPYEIFQRIECISANELKAVAFDMIHDQDVAVAALGALHEMPDYNWIRRRTFHTRL